MFVLQYPKYELEFDLKVYYLPALSKSPGRDVIWRMAQNYKYVDKNGCKYIKEIVKLVKLNEL